MNIIDTQFKNNKRLRSCEKCENHNKRVFEEITLKGIFKNNNFSTPLFHQSTPSLPLEHVNLIHPNPTLIQNNKIESILSELKKINAHNNNFIKGKVTNHVLPIGQRFIVVCDEETPLNFLSIISELFNKISSKSFGKQLLEEIEKEKHFVFIKYHKEKNELKTTDECKLLGTGSGSLIHLNGNSPSCFDFEGKEIPTPLFIVLAHELIHSMHAAKGKISINTNSLNNKLWDNDEEYATIMGSTNINQEIGKEISENAIRSEHKLPLRYSHHLYMEDQKIKDKILEEIALENFIARIFI